MKNLLSTICIFLLVVSGCNTEKTNEIALEDLGAEAHFCSDGNCEEVFLNYINSATKSVQCAFFDIDVGALTDSLGKKSSEVSVQVVIDKQNYENQLEGEGIRLADGVQYMHNKFCIIDEYFVITGSANPTFNGFELNDNNLIVISSYPLAKNYAEEFSELWTGRYSGGDPNKKTHFRSSDLVIENYFCPEDSCKENVLKTLDSAEDSIHFMTFSFTDEDIADVLLLKDVDVKGVVENRNANGIGSQYNRMKDFGMDVVLDKNKNSMHHKVFIVDEKIIITGSYNPTKSGDQRNDENVLIIRDPFIASAFEEEFQRVYNLAS